MGVAVSYERGNLVGRELVWCSLHSGSEHAFPVNAAVNHQEKERHSQVGVRGESSLLGGEGAGYSEKDGHSQVGPP